MRHSVNGRKDRRPDGPPLLFMGEGRRMKLGRNPFIVLKVILQDFGGQRRRF